MANILIDDDTTHGGTARVMRAYWLAPRTTRSATVLALRNHAPPPPQCAPDVRPKAAQRGLA
jgi:hypothetical protein